MMARCLPTTSACLRSNRLCCFYVSSLCSFLPKIVKVFIASHLAVNIACHVSNRLPGFAEQLRGFSLCDESMSKKIEGLLSSRCDVHVRRPCARIYPVSDRSSECPRL